MKFYQVRQDIVLCKVCGEYILVATKHAINECPTVQHINKSAAILWEQLLDGASLDDLKNALINAYKLPHIKAVNERIETDTIKLLNGLEESGYLISVEKRNGR